MIGRFYRPKPANQLNAFQSIGLPSQLASADPSLRNKKTGPRPDATPAQQIQVIGKTVGDAMLAKSLRIRTPSANQGHQRGQVQPSTMPYWLASIAIIAALAGAQQLDVRWDLSEVDAAQAVAEERAALESREWAARQMCGPEGSWKWRGDDLQCLDKRGRPTGRAVVIASAVKP